MTAWHPNNGERIGPAWRAIVANLEERGSSPATVCASIAVRAGGIQHKAAAGLVRDAVKHGLLVRVGSSVRLP